MATELIINASLPEIRVALSEDGEIQELLIERASDKGIVGNIYKGRVTRVLPGMQAAFVDIGLEKAAFLYVDDIYNHSQILEEEEGRESDAVVELRQLREDQEDSAAIDESKDGLDSSSDDTVDSLGSAEGVLERSVETSSELESENAEPDNADLESSQSNDEVRLASGTEVASAESESIAAVESEPVEERAFESPSAISATETDNSEGLPTSRLSEVKFDGQDSEKNSEHSLEDSSETPIEVVNSESAVAGEEGAEDEEKSEGEETKSGKKLSFSNLKKRFRRGRKGRTRRTDKETNHIFPKELKESEGNEGVEKLSALPETVQEHILDEPALTSDRSGVASENGVAESESLGGRPEEQAPVTEAFVVSATEKGEKKTLPGNRSEFREQRGRDRRIKSKPSIRQAKPQVNIQDLLKEGQEVLVQVAKDPIATKGARLTCHISLPGRHLVCMPTIDHVGVSRRIERDDERRRLRDFVEKNRPRGLGFIVRTASGKQSEKRVKEDIEYLSRIWDEIKSKTATLEAPALVYEDLNVVLRAIRDWVTEEIDRVIVDSRYYFNELQKFASHFMPSLRSKIELHNGNAPIFDDLGISSELSRSLERKVWLKSGGYLVIDQAEALVAIDVNTGRYVGKKNLEDTILKTNLEAVQEIAYQLRLRNCGGIIILDLIDMEKEENKQRVYRALEEALRKDRARPTIQKISDLGLIEMTRKRTRDTIIRTLCESCTHCDGKGYIKSKQTLAFEVLRDIERMAGDRDVNKILVQAHADVVDILALEERETVDQLERRLQKQIYLQAVSDFHAEQFEVTGDRKVKRSPEYYLESRSTDTRDRGRSRSSDRSRNGRDRDREKDKDRNRSSQRNEQSRIQVKAPALTPVQVPVQVNDEVVATDNPASDSSSAAEPKKTIRIEPRVIAPLAKPIIVAAPEKREDAESLESAAQQSSETESDPDNFGNQIGYQPIISKSQDVGVPADSEEDGFSEEDRLAFVRAQAAQDAALARMGLGGGVPGVGANHQRRDHVDQRGGRNQGRGGGRFDKRRGNNRDKRGFRGHSGSNVGQNHGQRNSQSRFQPRNGTSAGGNGNGSVVEPGSIEPRQTYPSSVAHEEPAFKPVPVESVHEDTDQS